MSVEFGDDAMNEQHNNEHFLETTVTYSIDIDGQFILVENVPARISVETGEQFFSPTVVDRLQQVVWEKKTPKRVVETPVFEFAT